MDRSRLGWFMRQGLGVDIPGIQPQLRWVAVVRRQLLAQRLLPLCGNEYWTCQVMRKTSRHGNSPQEEEEDAWTNGTGAEKTFGQKTCNSRSTVDRSTYLYSSGDSKKGKHSAFLRLVSDLTTPSSLQGQYKTNILTLFYLALFLRNEWKIGLCQYLFIILLM